MPRLDVIGPDVTSRHGEAGEPVKEGLVSLGFRSIQGERSGRWIERAGRADRGFWIKVWSPNAWATHPNESVS